MYIMFITNNHNSFHLWRKENLVKHQKVLKYYGQDCSVIVSVFSHTKCVFLSNQRCKVQPTPINLYPKGYKEELDYYFFAVKLDVLEVVILLMTYLKNYVFQIKQKI